MRAPPRGSEAFQALRSDKDGANVNATDNNKNTPPHYAAATARVDLVELVNSRPPSSRQNNDDKSPLDVARLNDQDDVVAALEKDVFRRFALDLSQG